MDRPRHQAQQAAANPGIEFLERVGYVVRGLLYAVMGFLALRIALGKPGGQATDLTGSLMFVIGNPFGSALLLIVIAGLAAYSLWGVVRAIFDPLHRGSDPSGLLERLGFLSSAFSYAAVALFAVHLLAGVAGAGGDSSVQRSVATILAKPAGGLITAGIGLVAMGIGIGQLMQAYTAKFGRDLKGAEMTKAEREVAVALGRFGMAARGVVFLLMGWLLLQAGTQHDPGKAKGFGGVFIVLLSQPFGHVLLAVVALGFIALGMHSIACARWMRLLGSAT